MPTADSVRYESPIMLKDIPQNKALTDHDEEMTLFDYHIYEYDGTTEARVIRAAVVMPDGTMGPVMTKTYFLMDDLSERYGCAVISIVTLIQGIMMFMMSQEEFEAKYVNPAVSFPLF